jgi:hypothetical protein
MIKDGSKVDVFFTSSRHLLNVEVLHSPNDVGDQWRLLDEHGKEHRVILFERMDEL